LPTHHFVERFLERNMAQGLRLTPAAFKREFLNARHYRQTRPNYRTRIAVVRGMPIVYRHGGPTGKRIVLISVWTGRIPPVAPVGAPSFEALYEAMPAAQAYAQRKAQYEACLRAYRPSPGARLPTRAGKAFRRAFARPRRAYLSCQHLDPDAPRFMQGWYRQEQRRQSLAARQRAAAFSAAGQTRTATRQKQLRVIAADPKQSASARQWAVDQLRRLAAGQKRLKSLQKRRTLRKPNVRIVPGYNVGHPIGNVTVRGKKVPHKALNAPTSFRTERAIQNQRRPAVAKRRGLPWAYQESDLWT
jgi:hypothetical protein